MINESGGAAHDVLVGDPCRAPARAVGGTAQLPRPRTGASVLAAAHAREARPRQGFFRSYQHGVDAAVDLAGAVPGAVPKHAATGRLLVWIGMDHCAVFLFERHSARPRTGNHY